MTRLVRVKVLSKGAPVDLETGKEFNFMTAKVVRWHEMRTVPHTDQCVYVVEVEDDLDQSDLR